MRGRVRFELLFGFVLMLLPFVAGCALEAIASPQREDFTAKWAAIAAAQEVSGPVTPAPSPVKPGVCPNCNGRGKVGDGTVMVTCAVCGGDGRVGNSPGLLDSSNGSKISKCSNPDCRCANCDGVKCACVVESRPSVHQPLVTQPLRESDLSPPIQIVPVAVLPRRASACGAGGCGAGSCSPSAAPAPLDAPPVVYKQPVYSQPVRGLFGRRCRGCR